MTIEELSLQLHLKNRGKVQVVSKVPLADARDLSLAYTPGVAEPCKRIFADKELVYDLTARGNMVAIVTDGSAVLGLGDIGPEAAYPVMEGKAILFKEFAGVDAFPLCINTDDPEKIIELVKLLEPTFGAVNLEDIAAPKCFEIERRLRDELDIPVFHDDQHGTAVVVSAALINAVKLVGKNLEEIKLVINGAGAAGTAIAKLLLSLGVEDIILCDRKGAIGPGYEGIQFNLAWQELAEMTNKKGRTGELQEIIKGSDVFIGVSAPNLLTREMVSSMNEPIVMALANPNPEIDSRDALEAGARLICTGRSDFPNQVNNLLAFPGILRGVLDVRARDINNEMKLAAAHALAGLIPDHKLRSNYVIPSPFDRRVATVVAQAVAQAARKSGVARLKTKPTIQDQNSSTAID